MRKLLCALLVAAGVAALSPDPSHAERCASPNARPLWTDVVGGPFWKRIWGKPGVIAATGSISATGGPDIPTQLRAAGATTIYWDLHLRNRVGTPSRPADPNVIVERANRLFDYTVRATDCSRPLIGLNELFGASTPTPWTPTNAQ